LLVLLATAAGQRSFRPILAISSNSTGRTGRSCTKPCWRTPSSMNNCSPSIAIWRRDAARGLPGLRRRAAFGELTAASLAADRRRSARARPAVQLLLFGRRLPRPVDAAFAAIPRPQGLSGGDRHLDCGDARRGDGAAARQARHDDRRRPPDGGAMGAAGGWPASAPPRRSGGPPQPA